MNMKAEETHYQVLKVQENASPAQIKKAYHKLALQHHPDRTGGDAETFQPIGEAYGVLSDPDKKLQYDDEMRNKGDTQNSPSNPAQQQTNTAQQQTNTAQQQQTDYQESGHENLRVQLDKSYAAQIKQGYKVHINYAQQKADMDQLANKNSEALAIEGAQQKAIMDQLAIEDGDPLAIEGAPQSSDITTFSANNNDSSLVVSGANQDDLANATITVKDPSGNIVSSFNVSYDNQTGQVKGACCPENFSFDRQSQEPWSAERIAAYTQTMNVFTASRGCEFYTPDQTMSPENALGLQASLEKSNLTQDIQTLIGKISIVDSENKEEYHFDENGRLLDSKDELYKSPALPTPALPASNESSDDKSGTTDHNQVTATGSNLDNAPQSDNTNSLQKGPALPALKPSCESSDEAEEKDNLSDSTAEGKEDSTTNSKDNDMGVNRQSNSWIVDANAAAALGLPDSISVPDVVAETTSSLGVGF